MSKEAPDYSKKEIEKLRAYASGKLDHVAVGDRLINKMSKTIIAKMMEACADPDFDETGIYLLLAQRPDLEPYLRDSPEWEQFMRANVPNWKPGTTNS